MGTFRWIIFFLLIVVVGGACGCGGGGSGNDGDGVNFNFMREHNQRIDNWNVRWMVKLPK